MKDCGGSKMDRYVAFRLCCRVAAVTTGRCSKGGLAGLGVEESISVRLNKVDNVVVIQRLLSFSIIAQYKSRCTGEQ